jgi:hypothetical protein
MALALAPALLASPVSNKLAFIRSREVSEDGKTVKVRVQVVKAGTYIIAAGHAVDRDTRFQFLEGSKSGIRYFDTRKVESARDNVTVDVDIPLKDAPPLFKSRIWAAVFSKAEEIPVTSP